MRAPLLILLVVASPVLAVQKPTTAQVVGDIATQPLQDTNIKKKRIPPVLEAAMSDPYDPAQAGSCNAIQARLAALNAVLGPDFDSASAPLPRISAGGVAKSVVQSLIPFRGVIREVTGAAGQERRYDNAVDAGIAQRGFLRGMARSRRCRVDVASN